MGHNVVIALVADRAAVATDGMGGIDAGDAKPGDGRVVAHSEMIGGGESTSATVPVGAIQGAGPYQFFCSAPYHWALMRGTIHAGQTA